MAASEASSTDFFPHVFALELKSADGGTTQVDFLEELTARDEKLKLDQPVKDYFRSLTERRSALCNLLDSVEGEASTVDDAMNEYLSRLNHLMLPSEETPGGNPPDQLKMVYLVRFQWRDAFGKGTGIASTDVRFEIVSMLLSVALWRARKGAQLVSKPDGLAVGSDAVLKMYSLYREAVGIIDHILKILPHLVECPSQDCDKSVLEGVKHLLLADAQSITVLRAIEKGNAPKLISSLALGVHEMYSTAYDNIQSKAGDSKSDTWRKVAAYTKYKAACFECYALAYSAYAKLEDSQGGDAVSFAREAVQKFPGIQSLGMDYDSVAPKSPVSDRKGFHDALGEVVTKASNQAENDNKVVFFQKIPVEVPEFPDSQQLVKPVVFAFPTPTSSVDRTLFSKFDVPSVQPESSPYQIVEIKQDKKGNAQQGGGEEDKGETKEGSSCWRWLLVVISIPILLLITIIGIIVWILLFPVKCCCCPLGCAAQILWDVTEWVVKAPFRAALWASGEPWVPQRPTAK